MAERSVSWFNQLPVDDVRALLRECNAAEPFVHQVAAGRPYASAADAADAAQAASLGLDWADVALALEAHPRIGERAAGEDPHARSSRAEQAAMDSAGDDVRAALAEHNRAYERRFGHVYLVRAAGRSPTELLDELLRRLDNDAETERGEVTRELAEITRLRVEGVVGR